MLPLTMLTLGACPALNSIERRQLLICHGKIVDDEFVLKDKDDKLLVVFRL